MSNDIHFCMDLVTELSIGKHIALHQILFQVCGCSITDQCVATTDVEIDIRQWVKTEVGVAGIDINHSHHLQEQAELGDFRSLYHNIYAVEVAQDDVLVDEVTDIGAVLAL